MKKLVLLLIALLCLCACTEKPDMSEPFELETYACDMSGYEGLSSTKHMFKGTTVKELERTINEKGYGVFVLSREGCDHCQMSMRYLNEVAEELGVTVYYIDAMSDVYPILGTDNYQILYDILYTTLNEGDNGKEIQTPEVFTVIDGVISKYQIGTTWKGLDYDDNDINELKSVYRKMLTPFSR